MANARMNNNYVYGNTAPAYNPEEGYYYQEEIRRREERILREEEELRRRQNLRRLRREKKRIRRSVVSVAMATVVVMAMASMLVYLQASVNTRMKNVVELEEQVMNLRESNDAMEKRIATAVSIEDVKNIAINELGMAYPEESQIQYYHVDKTDYMEQYKDIPNNNKVGAIFGMMFKGDK